MQRINRILFILCIASLWLAAQVIGVAGESAINPAKAPVSNLEQHVDSTAWIIWETAAPVQRLALDGGQLWVGHEQGGLSRWDLGRGLERSFSGADGLPGEDVLDIVIDSNGDIWVALLDGSVARSGDGSSFADLSPPPPADDNAWALDAVGGEVVLGTLGGGVAHRSGGTWSVDTSADSALPFDDIYAAALQSDGTAWVGTLGYGVAAKRAGVWTVFEPPLTIPDPLNMAGDVANQAITDIAIDGSGAKWFTTDGSGLAVLNSSNSNWTVYDQANSGLTSNFVQSVFLDSAGNRWFGTLGGGISRFSSGGGWSSYHSGNSPLPEDDVLDVVVDNEGGIWLAAYDSGLAFYGNLPSQPPGFVLAPEGEPDILEGASRGYFLWLDTDTYLWNLAWSGDGQAHQFEGFIEADAPLSLIENDDFEGEDSAVAEGNRLTIDATEGSGHDKVTFELDRAATELTIGLQIDGAYYPYSIQVGAGGDLPGTAPFRLSAVHPTPPVVDAGEDTLISEGSYAFLSGNFQDPDSPAGHIIQWNFGDLTPIEEGLYNGHIYADNGLYTATLTVTDVHGLSGSASLSVTVENIPPEVDFFTDPFLPNIGEEVAFEAIIFDPGIKDTHTYTWDYGDGGDPFSTDEPIVLHTYLEVGEYPVTLTVKDDDGGIGEASYALTVTGNNPPEMTLPGPAELLEGEEWLASVEFSDPDSEQWTTSIDYGDGTDPVEMSLEDTVPFELSHVYADNGMYTVDIVLTDDAGASTAGAIEVAVSNVAPALVASTPGPFDESEAFTLELASFSDPGFDCAECGTEENFTAEIDWDDGVVEVVQVDEVTGGAGIPTTGTITGTHVYPDNGVYSILLTVCDDDGDCGNGQLELMVNNLPPTFELDWNGALEIGAGITFIGRKGVEQTHSATATDPGTDDLTFSWSSGAVNHYYNDGVSQDPPKSPAGEHPFTASDDGTFLFEEPGAYTPNIEVTDDDGGVVGLSFSKLITGDEACTRSQGFWKHQFSGKGKAHIDNDTLLRYLEIVELGSDYFGEVVSLNSVEDADEIMNPKGSDKRKKAEAQLLAAWLNFAHGAVGWDESVPLPEGEPQPFHEVVGDAEELLLNPDASHQDLVQAKDLAEAINLLDEGTPGCEGADDDGDDADDGDDDDGDDDDGDDGQDGDGETLVVRDRREDSCLALDLDDGTYAWWTDEGDVYAGDFTYDERGNRLLLASSEDDAYDLRGVLTTKGRRTGNVVLRVPPYTDGTIFRIIDPDLDDNQRCD